MLWDYQHTPRICQEMNYFEIWYVIVLERNKKLYIRRHVCLTNQLCYWLEVHMEFYYLSLYEGFDYECSWK